MGSMRTRVKAIAVLHLGRFYEVDICQILVTKLKCYPFFTLSVVCMHIILYML